MANFVTNVNYPNAADVADAADLKTALTADGFVAKLFQAGWEPSETSVVADFDAHEADFTGYASVANGGAGRLWSDPVEDDSGNIGLLSPSNLFVATDAVNPNVIGGIWIEKTAGDLFRYYLFPAGVDMVAAMDFIDAIFFESPHDVGYVSVQT